VNPRNVSGITQKRKGKTNKKNDAKIRNADPGRAETWLWFSEKKKGGGGGVGETRLKAHPDYSQNKKKGTRGDEPRTTRLEQREKKVNRKRKGKEWV